MIELTYVAPPPTFGSSDVASTASLLGNAITSCPPDTRAPSAAPAAEATRTTIPAIAAASAARTPTAQCSRPISSSSATRGRPRAPQLLELHDRVDSQSPGTHGA